MIPFNPFSVYAGTAGWVHPEPPRPRRSSRQSARDCAVEHQAHLQAPALVWTFGRVHLDQIASLARQKGSGSGKLTRSNFMHHRSLLKNQITWFFIIFPSLWSSSCPLFQFVQVGAASPGPLAGALIRLLERRAGAGTRAKRWAVGPSLPRKERHVLGKLEGPSPAPVRFPSPPPPPGSARSGDLGGGPLLPARPFQRWW